MTLPLQYPTPGATAHAAPRRALGLGAIFSIVLLLGVLWCTRSTAATYAALDRRATINTVDAIPLVAQTALTLSLTWAAVLVLLSMRTLQQHLGAQRTGECLSLPAGVVGRVATILLAATVITSTTVAAAPGTFAASQTRVELHDPAPHPSFSTSQNDNASARDQSCPPPAPVPGWTAVAPARATAIGTASAPLVTGCARSQDAVSEMVVRRGDSLWTMVARHLHTDDPAVIATQWPRWYAANRTAVGPDPDLIHTGQVLRIPPMDHTSSARQGGVR